MQKSFVVGGCMLLLFCACNRQPKSVENKQWKLLTLSEQSVTLNQTYSASLQGKQDIRILPQVSGFLTGLCVTEGEFVKKGQTLFLIDSVNYAAALRVARANVKAAEAVVASSELTYQSKQQLFADSIISAYDLSLASNNLLSAKAQLAQAQAGVVNAEQNLSYTVVKSPCDGVVGKLPFRVGTLVSPQMTEPLTTVSDNSEMYVYFSVSEVQVLHWESEYGSLRETIRKMPPLQLQLADNTVYPLSGRIESISGVIDSSTGSVSIRAAFPNEKRNLLSGGSCNVIMPYTRNNVILIPQQATYEIQNKTYAYVVQDGKAVSRVIQVSPVSDGKQYIVESGLQKGEVVIAEGAAFVHEGEQIN